MSAQAVAEEVMPVGSRNNEDEIRRKLLKPKVTPDEALSILSDFYIDASRNIAVSDANPSPPRAEVIQELDSYDDVNYLVKIDGVRYLLKIHNGVESEKLLKARQSAKKRPRLDQLGSNDYLPLTSIIQLHTAIYRHLAKPRYNVTTCTTVPMMKYQDDRENDNSVCIRNLAVSATKTSYHGELLPNRWIHAISCEFLIIGMQS